MSIHTVWGPPQSGKTTLAVDLAFALSAHNQSVLLISPEQYSELSARLNIKIPAERSLSAAYKNKASLKQIVCTADDLLYVLAVPYDYDAFGEDLPEDTAKAVIEESGKLFDEVIIDCPSHTGSVLAAWALSCADNVFLMSGATSAAIPWNTAYQKAVDTLEQKTMHICSQVNEAFDYRTLHTALDIAPDLWLPYIPNASMVQLLKRTLYQSGGKLGKEYSQSIDALCSRCIGQEVDV